MRPSNCYVKRMYVYYIIVLYADALEKNEICLILLTLKRLSIIRT